ncbi:MAG TPA: hypothetical protein VMA36_19635 [Candidatus Limnocylindria bacterium]|jgi:hypothetical protein|nr:hypothetical protein [Candidatus Limnocylindria bacterium]
MFIVLALATIPFHYDGALRPGQTLTVRDINGTVRVHEGGSLRIDATKHAEHGDPAAVAIHVEPRPDGLIVCVRYPPDAQRGCADGGGGTHVSTDNDTAVDFDVTLPRDVRLDAQTVNGSIDAQTAGEVSAATVNGRVSVDAPAIRAAKSVNGSLDLRLRARGDVPLTAKTVNGSIRVDLPPGSGARVAAKTLLGGIDVPGLAVDKPRFGPGASANGTLGGGGRDVDLQTVNGTITLRR